MSRGIKFAFDTVFDDEDEPEVELPEEEEPPPPPTFSEAELEQARAEGHARGREEAAAAAMAADERRMADSLEAVARQFGALAPGFEQGWDRCRREALTVAGALARKVMPAAMEDAATETVEAVLRDILPGLVDEPRLVIRVADSLIEPLRERLDGTARKSGYPGKVILLADETMKAADCRVEWADGGAEFNSERMWREIDEAVARHRNRVNEDTTADAADTKLEEETIDG